MSDENMNERVRPTPSTPRERPAATEKSVTAEHPATTERPVTAERPPTTERPATSVRPPAPNAESPAVTDRPTQPRPVGGYPPRQDQRGGTGEQRPFVPRTPNSQGGFHNGPRPAGGPGGYNNGPRPAGNFTNGPRPADGQGNFTNGPRPAGSFNNGPRPAGGFSSGPRPAGGINGNGGVRPSGGYNGGGPPRSPNGGGFGNNRPGGFTNGPRPAGGGFGPPRGPAGASAGPAAPPGLGGGVGRGIADGRRPSRGSSGGKPAAPSGIPAKPGTGNGRFSENKPRQTSGRKNTHTTARSAVATKVKTTGPITLPSTIIVKDLAELLEMTPNEIIVKLIGKGVFANINQVIDFSAAAAVATEIGFEPTEAAAVNPVSAVKSEVLTSYSKAQPKEKLLARPPVVTVMGHVDHGKTSLLDAIRKTKVAAGEAGGITQHIGAYQVETTDGRPVTFLDTPGHEAFTAMRARGAKVTDIAIIVVAADDGVMPQTREAIDHARAAQVPLIIALNKIDKPNANPDFVKNQLAEIGVVIEEYGGDVVCAPVSAKKGTGIEELLEMILLVADVQNLDANPSGDAVGTVLEARVDKNSGIVANILVQDGTLKIGDILVVGTISAKVRAMFDDTGERVKTAGPSTPVSVLGLNAVPIAGDHFTTVNDEKSARALIENHRLEEETTNAALTLDTLYQQMQQGKIKELNLLLKADVQGSLDALRSVLGKLGTDQFKVRLIHEGVGNISETDVHLASASKAIVIGFNTKPDGAAQRVSQNEHVDIRFYDVIYKLVDDIESALKGMLEPVYKDVIEGHAEILQLFKAGKTIIGGAKVTDGKIARSASTKVLRNGKTIFNGKIGSLKRNKDDAREVATGFECGITIDDFNDLQIGDIIETSIKVRV